MSSMAFLLMLAVYTVTNADAVLGKYKDETATRRIHFPKPGRCNVGLLMNPDWDKLQGEWLEMAITRLSTHNEERYLQNYHQRLTYVSEEGTVYVANETGIWSNESGCLKWDYTYKTTKQPGVLAAVNEDGKILFEGFVVDIAYDYYMCAKYFADLDEYQFTLWSKKMFFSASEVVNIVNRISSDPCLREKRFYPVVQDGRCGLPPGQE
ncbi:uncharacterized protein LOC106154515 [Lingula anatina]|uniref:Uncharacterized protein LOC106154515 n=1 Tax=Lingula anatina TaxID=7574 RepID=A0A1S3HFS4_LINAN|nr:uncharacterized protein LOC106154515 [Lingula anatina]|eukprot:XP_013384331.1 uncharacterized protein LOC106154515 [Lingula anatina]